MRQPETPFQFRGETYVQIDGVSMGSPLGPTFADFYMSHLENAVLSLNRVSNPVFYRLYVDDILAVFTTERHVNLFKRRLEHSSVLKFTHESMTDNTFHFLDSNLPLMTWVTLLH